MMFKLVMQLAVSEYCKTGKNSSFLPVVAARLVMMVAMAAAVAVVEVLVEISPAGRENGSGRGGSQARGISDSDSGGDTFCWLSGCQCHSKWRC